MNIQNNIETEQNFFTFNKLKRVKKTEICANCQRQRKLVNIEKPKKYPQYNTIQEELEEYILHNKTNGYWMLSPKLKECEYHVWINKKQENKEETIQ